ncbi:MAG: sigma-70 family RNA polymerase sigma factor [Terricaulis sp.]
MASDETIGLAIIQRAPRVEAALWRKLRFEQDSLSRGALFARHLEFARRVARREWRRWPAAGLERADYEQLAVAGLLEAIDHFDPLRRVPFEAFALARLRGAITDGAQRASEAGTRHAYERRVRNERLRALARQDANHDPITALGEISALLAIGFIAEGAMRQIENTGYETARWRELEQSLLAEITRLEPRQRMVIEQHYLHGVAFADIAVVLELTPGRVSQLHRQGLTRLRERLKRSD